jgi:hypothetical protein
MDPAVSSLSRFSRLLVQQVIVMISLLEKDNRSPRCALPRIDLAGELFASLRGQRCWAGNIMRSDEGNGEHPSRNARFVRRRPTANHTASPIPPSRRRDLEGQGLSPSPAQTHHPENRLKLPFAKAGMQPLREWTASRTSQARRGHYLALLYDLPGCIDDATRLTVPKRRQLRHNATRLYSHLCCLGPGGKLWDPVHQPRETATFRLS